MKKDIKAHKPNENQSRDGKDGSVGVKQPRLRLVSSDSKKAKSQIAKQLNAWADRLELEIEIIMRS